MASNYNNVASSIINNKRRFNTLDIIHDKDHYMFKLLLDKEGNTGRFHLFLFYPIF